MKIEAVMINDKKAKKHFAFVKQFPAVCAQGDSIGEVQSKIKTNYISFIERMMNEKVEFTQSELSI